jgi:hypothetical protein
MHGMGVRAADRSSPWTIVTPDYPAVRAENIGWLTETQTIEVDRGMIDDLRIELIQMMETPAATSPSSYSTDSARTPSPCSQVQEATVAAVSSRPDTWSTVVSMSG